MLVAELLKSRNDVSQLPSFFGEMVLDPWRDFQESAAAAQNPTLPAA